MDEQWEKKLPLKKGPFNRQDRKKTNPREVRQPEIRTFLREFEMAGFMPKYKVPAFVYEFEGR
jgi:hypothetical protein